MKTPEEFEAQINKAIEELVAKGFELKRGSYGNDIWGCALTAGFLSSLSCLPPFITPYQIKKWAAEQVGLSEVEHFENGFDRWDFDQNHPTPFFIVGVRVGQRWKPGWKFPSLPKEKQ